MSKVTQNPISLTPIGVKITKSPLRNLTHQGLSKKYQECNQVFLSFDFVQFPLRKLYSIQSLRHCITWMLYHVDAQSSVIYVEFCNLAVVGMVRILFLFYLCMHHKLQQPSLDVYLGSWEVSSYMDGPEEKLPLKLANDSNCWNKCVQTK
jgi:hypothetical protein